MNNTRCLSCANYDRSRKDCIVEKRFAGTWHYNDVSNLNGCRYTPLINEQPDSEFTGNIPTHVTGV